MNILSIETSCDETAIALISKVGENITVLSNIISSQIELHRKWGGVVPNLAGREHAKNILPVLSEAIIKSGLKVDDIDLLSVTKGPGLAPALLIGVTASKSLAYKWNKALMGIHHIEGHIYANWIGDKKPEFPALTLVVSGGHTQLIIMKNHCEYEIIGQTLDDAVGEAFDKVARLMGLFYPGGPEISREASLYDKNLDTFDIKFPRPMKNSEDYNFSFSGIKTAVLYTVRKYQKEQILKKFTDKKNISKEEYEKVKLPIEFVRTVSFEFQNAVVEVLIHKSLRAIDEYGVNSMLIAGGVSANSFLRERLEKKLSNKFPEVSYHIPEQKYCIDNAVMIAVASAYRLESMTEIERKKLKFGWKNVVANPAIKMC